MCAFSPRFCSSPHVAASDPIGLSLEGTRLAWAENVRGRGRIRAITLG